MISQELARGFALFAADAPKEYSDDAERCSEMVPVGCLLGVC